MDVLILGGSRIAERRVIPALQAIRAVSAIHVASRTKASRIELKSKRGLISDDYARALAQLPPGSLVYVSLPNAYHTQWARESLMLGLHVVIDKPATLSAAEANELVDLARARGLLLAETIVWHYHPQVASALKLLTEAGGATAVTAIFSVPPFTPADIRNSKELGGGCINDMGPYAMSVGRLFLGDRPESVLCHIRSRHAESGVDTAFSIMNTYSGGSLVGHFGFDTNYTHTLTIVGPNRTVMMDRPFAPPPDQLRDVRWTDASGDGRISVPPSDTFKLFFEDIFDAIARAGAERFYTAMSNSAEDLQRLRSAVMP
jgi:NDP-hexose-3-ketoreductase